MNSIWTGGKAIRGTFHKEIFQQQVFVTMSNNRSLMFIKHACCNYVDFYISLIKRYIDRLFLHRMISSISSTSKQSETQLHALFKHNCFIIGWKIDRKTKIAWQSIEIKSNTLTLDKSTYQVDIFCEWFHHNSSFQ